MTSPQMVGLGHGPCNLVLQKLTTIDREMALAVRRLYLLYLKGLLAFLELFSAYFFFLLNFFSELSIHVLIITYFIIS